MIEALERRLDAETDRTRVRRTTAEHPFGTLKTWMGAAHFQTKILPRVSTEMSLHVLAYNLKRVINILGARPLMAAIRSPCSIPNDVRSRIAATKRRKRRRISGSNRAVG